MTTLEDYIPLAAVVLAVVACALLVACVVLAAQTRRAAREAARIASEADAALVEHHEQVSQALGTLSADMARWVGSLAGQMREADAAASKELGETRVALDERLKGVKDAVSSQAQAIDGALSRQISVLQSASDAQARALAQMRASVEGQLGEMRNDNAAKLEQMRQTVDEKLQSTLDRRMTESFAQVSTQLEEVYKGLGEMRGLAQGVTDLSRVLSNVKTRGIVGEIQLGAILKQILAPEQYGVNVATVPGSSCRVEYAVRLPGEAGQAVWLPIDAKFPADAYEHLRAAQETGDRVAAEDAWRALEGRLKSEARDICGKYVAPPATTSFGVLFLPVEGLYAEVVSRPGLIECLQRDYRVNVCGPSTMAALLNSLQMGFQTVAIQKNADEIAQTLRAVEEEIGKYHGMLEKAQTQIRRAEGTIDTIITTRTNAIRRKLRSVSQLDLTQDAEAILGIGAPPEEDES